MANGSQRGFTSTLTVREVLGQAIVLCVLLCVMFPGATFRGEMLAPGDLLFNYPPWSEARPPELEIKNPWWTLEAITALNKFYWLANRALDGGEWPLWNDLEMGGMPLIANGQSAVFYPPRLLHRAMDLFPATTIYILLKLLLCGLTAYICARVMHLSRMAARIVSIGWMLCGYNVLWSYWPLPDVSAWLPLELAAVELLLQQRYRKGFCTLVISAALLMLAGHPETAFTGSFWIGAYFFMRLVWVRVRGGAVLKPLALAGGAWGAGLLASAVQVLPTLEYLANTSRVTSLEWTPGVRHLDWTMLHGFWLPNYAARSGDLPITLLWVVWLFVGLTVWVGLAAGAIHAGFRRDLNARIVFLAVGAGMALVFSVSNPLTDWLLFPPSIASMWQRYHIAFVLLAVLVMGAAGIDAWLRRPRKKREVQALLLCVCFVFVIGLSWYVSTRPLFIVAETNDAMVRQLAIAGGAIAASSALLLIRAQGDRPRWIGSALTIVLAAELVISLGRYHHTVPREHFFVDTELTRFLQEQPRPMRIHTPIMIPGLMPFYGLEMMRGYDGLYPEHAVWHFAKEDSPPSMRRALAITHTLERPASDEGLIPRPARFAPDQRELLGVFGETNKIEVYRVTDSLPRAHLVSSLEVVADEAALAERFLDPDFDPSRTALTLDAQEAFAEPAGIDLGDAEVVRQTSTTVDVKVNASAKCVLVLADTYYPGWQAYCDGERVELLRINGSMRGVVVPGGESSVEFRYRPMSFAIGLWTSTLSLVAGLCAGSYIGFRYRSKTKKQPTRD